RYWVTRHLAAMGPIAALGVYDAGRGDPMSKGPRMKAIIGLAAIPLAAPAMSQNAMPPDPATNAIMQPRTTPATQAMDQAPVGQPPSAAAYPACSATITDKCVSQQTAGKTPVRKAAPAPIVRKDKVHRRKG